MNCYKTPLKLMRDVGFFDSVLASVTSGVIGLNPSGKISFINRSAISLLNCDDKNLENTTLIY